MSKQLDRIENMVKIILQANTTVVLDDSENKGNELRNEVKTYKNKNEVSQ